ncbi:hypothetical protein [Acinetobacter pittii]|uniref:hypothetical protein n=1 Tax=Acinetobacter pittii TaxID=48296 RepID=UPI0024DEE94F|nr:hypothetical protein [Acinetobacter pittii]
MIDFNIIGCDSELEFLKLIRDSDKYEAKIISTIDNLERNNFATQKEYEKRMADLLQLKHTYKVSFCQPGSGAEYHWHFLEGFEAFSKGVLIPSLLSFICGIEASMRSTLYIMTANPGNKIYVKELMKMDLIHEAYEKGLPVSTLAFKHEQEFMDKIINKTKIHLLKIRNDLMHGNIKSYCKQFNEDRIFTPELLLNDLLETIIISRKWIAELSEVRKSILTKAPI